MEDDFNDTSVLKMIEVSFREVEVFGSRFSDEDIEEGIS